MNCSASGRVLPTSFCVMIDADAVQIAQPLPSNFSSAILPLASRAVTSISSPHNGFESWPAISDGSTLPLLRGRR